MQFEIGDYSLVIKEIPDCLVTASFPAKSFTCMTL